MIDLAHSADPPPVREEGAARAAAVDPPRHGADVPGVGAPPEIGGRQGPDPTRYGDWELRGRCIDF